MDPRFLIIFATVTLLAGFMLTGLLGSEAGEVLQGDTDCSGVVDGHDALSTLLYTTGVGTPGDCFATAGDVNCDQTIDEADVLALLQFLGGIAPPVPPSSDCTPIGEPLTSTPTSSASLTPSEPATATPSATPTTTPTGTPPAEPQANGYHLDTVIADAALGVADNDTVDLTLWPGDPNVAIIVRQTGQMYRVSLTGAFAPQLWGDLSGKVTFDSEQGLLSLTFSPNFAQDGKVYAYYTPGASTSCCTCPPDSPDVTVLARYDVVNGYIIEASEEIILEVEDFNRFHNGGRLVFDASGYLLLGFGDGGYADDPCDAGQDLTTLLGKIIRIDVSTETGYAIPPDNPYASAPPALPEIYASGFRNPWRMSVDQLTGDLWVGDVGQAKWEEVDRVMAGGNYGWDCYEGFADHDVVSPKCDGKTFQTPRAVYGHNVGGGVAIVGGYVYRGTRLSELYGWYVYADYVSGRIWAVDTESNDLPVLLLDDAPTLTSFTERPDGELLIVSYNQGIFELARN